MLKRVTGGSALILVAVGLGILTMIAAMTWVSRDEAEQEQIAQQTENTVEAVVAAQDVRAGERLTADMLEVREIPEIAYLSGAAGSVESVVGRVARYPLSPGEQVTSRKLVTADEGVGTGLAFSVPAGMRAMSVSINEVRGAGGNIVPGDRVDVLVSTDYERMFGPTELLDEVVVQAERRHPTVLTVLQDVLVLGIAQSITPPNDEERDGATLRSDEAEPNPGAGSVTLAVTSEQAQSLFFAAQEGTVGLVLRPYGDTSTSTLEPAFRLEPLAPVSGALTGN